MTGNCAQVLPGRRWGYFGQKSKSVPAESFSFGSWGNTSIVKLFLFIVAIVLLMDRFGFQPRLSPNDQQPTANSPPPRSGLSLLSLVFKAIPADIVAFYGRRPVVFFLFQFLCFCPEPSEAELGKPNNQHGSRFLLVLDSSSFCTWISGVSCILVGFMG